MKTDYRLLMAENALKLSKDVQTLLDEGFSLYGSPSCALSTNAGEMEMIYVQAVVKTKDVLAR
jgi:hypothetical protein